MSNRTFRMQESAKLYSGSKGFAIAEISVVQFCGPAAILEDEETRVCVQVDITSLGDVAIMYMTKSQALKLAEEIQNVYRKADRTSQENP